MSRRVLRAVGRFLLIAALLFGGSVPIAAETISAPTPIASLETGTYTITITFTDSAYYVPFETKGLPDYPGLALAPYTPAGFAQTDQWEVTRLSVSRCTLRNPSLGEKGYLNLSPSGALTFGEKQEISYIQNGGLFSFFITQGSTRYYLRVTNQNVSRFHAGTGTTSNTFQLLRTTTYDAEYSDAAGAPLPEEEPLLTLACISDLHADYGLQNQEPYIRNSVLKTIDAIARYEDADILISGGDNTSDNAGVSDKGGWTPETYAKVIDQYRALSEFATDEGYSLWVAGNHDFQAGEDEGYDSYAGFVKLMEDANGKPKSVYRQKNDSSLGSTKYPNYVLGLHYNIKNFDFIIINAPYGQAKAYSNGTYSWLNGRLRSIGKDKTVFLLTHYPLTDGRNISTPNYGTAGVHYEKLTGILKNYPNVIYLHGHDHGNTDGVYINSDTFERITSYTPMGTVVNDRNVVPTSFITSFMGSMWYYNNKYQSGAPGWQDSVIVQSLIVKVYGDRIVFQTKNFGTTLADVTPLSWTVMRNIAGDSSGSSTSTSTVTSSATSDSSETTDVPSGTVLPPAVSDAPGIGSDVSGNSRSTGTHAGAGASADEGGSLWIPLLITVGLVLLLGGGAAGILLFLRPKRPDVK